MIMKTYISTNNYYAQLSFDDSRYKLFDKEKCIGLTNENRFVFHIEDKSSSSINLNIIDLKEIIELCELCNIELSK